ncbi:DciA family protein [Thioalkalivibrio sp. ALMg11]|uniref:DciA family protein n=1 Tax=Thioalkalivibrio sp. ALMg11 TaxID=1158165 RepID=UPI00037B58DC|nr:DciA family protein [Thioalkalivibrio sp. ALMg11]
MTAQRITRFIARDFAAHSSRDRGVERALEGLVGNALQAGRLAFTLREDTLVAICANRGLATELRFQQRELLKTLRAAGYEGIEQIRIRLTNTPRPPQPTTRLERREIPDAARRILADTASNIQDPGLAGALERLARAARPSPKAD